MFAPQPMPLTMPTFQDCSNLGAGGSQVRCCKCFAPSGGPGQWLQAQGFLEADSPRQSLEPSSSRSIKVNSAVHCGGRWGYCGEKRMSSLSTWGSQSSGEGDKQSQLPFGTLGRLGRQAKNDLAERRRKNWSSGEKDNDSGSCLNVLSAPGGQDGSRDITKQEYISS